jgi:hypothetical protein
VLSPSRILPKTRTNIDSFPIMARYIYSGTLLFWSMIAINVQAIDNERKPIRQLRGNVDCSMVLCANPCDDHMCNIHYICQVTTPNGKGQCCGRAKCVKIDDTPVAVPCGKHSCEGGQVCCNESCGICTEPDAGCIALYCEP